VKFPPISGRSIALALLFSFIPLLFLAGCARTEEAEEGGQAIQVKGSDTMVNLSTHWAEVFMEEHPGAQISVTGGGSGMGIAALLNGTADLVTLGEGRDLVHKV
jgi:phosphate transport system substrate-binding protein